MGTGLSALTRQSINMDFQPLSLLTAVAGLIAGLVLCWLVMRKRPGTDFAADFAADASLMAPGREPENDAWHEEMLAELTLARHQVETLQAGKQQAQTNLNALDQKLATAQQALEVAQAALVTQTAQAAQAAEAAGKQALQSDLATDLQAQLNSLQAKDEAAQQALQQANRQAEISDADSASKTESLAQAADQLATAVAENQTLSGQLSGLAALEVQVTQLEAQAAIRIEKATELPVLETEVIQLQALAKCIQQEFVVLQDVQRNFTAASSALQAVS